MTTYAPVLRNLRVSKTVAECVPLSPFAHPISAPIPRFGNSHVYPSVKSCGTCTRSSDEILAFVDRHEVLVAMGCNHAHCRRSALHIPVPSGSWRGELRHPALDRHPFFAGGGDGGQCVVAKDWASVLGRNTFTTRPDSGNSLCGRFPPVFGTVHARLPLWTWKEELISLSGSYPG